MPAVQPYEWAEVASDWPLSPSSWTGTEWTTSDGSLLPVGSMWRGTAAENWRQRIPGAILWLMKFKFVFVAQHELAGGSVQHFEHCSRRYGILLRATAEVNLSVTVTIPRFGHDEEVLVTTLGGNEVYKHVGFATSLKVFDLRHFCLSAMVAQNKATPSTKINLFLGERALRGNYVLVKKLERKWRVMGDSRITD